MTASWMDNYPVGHYMDARDSEGKWLECEVVRQVPPDSPPMIKVHYLGWDEKWDEWLDLTRPDVRQRLAKLHRYSKCTRLCGQDGSGVKHDYKRRLGDTRSFQPKQRVLVNGSEALVLERDGLQLHVEYVGRPHPADRDHQRDYARPVRRWVHLEIDKIEPLSRSGSGINKRAQVPTSASLFSTPSLPPPNMPPATAPIGMYGSGDGHDALESVPSRSSDAASSASPSSVPSLNSGRNSSSVSGKRMHARQFHPHRVTADPPDSTRAKSRVFARASDKTEWMEDAETMNQRAGVERHLPSAPSIVDPATPPSSTLSSLVSSVRNIFSPTRVKERWHSGQEVDVRDTTNGKWNEAVITKGPTEKYPSIMLKLTKTDKEGRDKTVDLRRDEWPYLLAQRGVFTADASMSADFEIGDWLSVIVHGLCEDGGDRREPMRSGHIKRFDQGQIQIEFEGDGQTQTASDCERRQWIHPKRDKIEEVKRRRENQQMTDQELKQDADVDDEENEREAGERMMRRQYDESLKKLDHRTEQQFRQLHCHNQSTDHVSSVEQRFPNLSVSLRNRGASYPSPLPDTSVTSPSSHSSSSRPPIPSSHARALPHSLQAATNSGVSDEHQRSTQPWEMKQISQAMMNHVQSTQMENESKEQQARDGSYQSHAHSISSASTTDWPSTASAASAASSAGSVAHPAALSSVLVDPATFFLGVVRLSMYAPLRERVGIVNNGLTCYMSASLQCLASLQPLIQYFLVEQHYRHILDEKRRLRSQNRNNYGMDGYRDGYGRGRNVDWMGMSDGDDDVSQPESGLITMEFARIMADLYRRLPNRRSIDVSPLRHRIVRLPNGAGQGFRTAWQMQDAHEFMTILMGALQNELNLAHQQHDDEQGNIDEKLKQTTPHRFTTHNHDPTIDPILNPESLARAAWQQHQHTKNDIINHLLTAQTAQYVICRQCRHVSLKHDVCGQLTLDIPKRQRSFYASFTLAQHEQRVTLRECLDHQLSVDELDDYKCGRCNNRVTAWKSSYFTHLPPILIMQLKRFDRMSGPFGLMKDETLIDFPLEIDVANIMKPSNQLLLPTHIQPFIAADATRPDGVRYRLKAIVLHAASHYIAVAKVATKPSHIHSKHDVGAMSGVSSRSGVVVDDVGAWCSFDDAKSYIEEESVITNDFCQRHAYLLFYQRCMDQATKQETT